MNEYTAYREGYSDGFNDGVEFMQNQFVKNCEEAKKDRQKDSLNGEKHVKSREGGTTWTK